jgi:hypothetical protein
LAEEQVSWLPQGRESGLCCPIGPEQDGGGGVAAEERTEEAGGANAHTLPPTHGTAVQIMHTHGGTVFAFLAEDTCALVMRSNTLSSLFSALLLCLVAIQFQEACDLPEDRVGSVSARVWHGRLTQSRRRRWIRNACARLVWFGAYRVAALPNHYRAISAYPRREGGRRGDHRNRRKWFLPPEPCILDIIGFCILDVIGLRPTLIEQPRHAGHHGVRTC